MPPLRHLVFFKLSAAATPAKVASMRQALLALPSQIPGTLYYNVFHHYEPLIPSTYPAANKGYSLVIDSIFDGQAALAAYAPHPAHQAAVNDHIAPIREDNLVIDYELPASFNIDAFKQLQSSYDHLRHFIILKAKKEVDQTAWTTIIKQIEQIETEIPTIINTSSGAQDTASMYQGYADRSKGFKEVVEMVMKPPSSLEQYLFHPKHDAVVQGLKPLSDDIFIFDYVCGGTGTGKRE